MFEQKHPAGSKLMSPLGISEQLILSSCKGNKDFPCDSDDKESACNVGDLGLIPGLERSPEEDMATHSSILACRTP